MSTLLPFKAYFEPNFENFYKKVDQAIANLSKDVTVRMRLNLEDQGEALQLNDFYFLRYYREVHDVQEDRNLVPLLDDIENLAALDPEVGFFDRVFGWTPNPGIGLFVLFVEITDNPNNDKTIRLNIKPTTGDTITIYWGDGTSNDYIGAGNQETLSHTYLYPGVFLIRVEGVITNIRGLIDTVYKRVVVDAKAFRNTNPLTQIVLNNIYEVVGDLSDFQHVRTALRIEHASYMTGDLSILKDFTSNDDIYISGADRITASEPFTLPQRNNRVIDFSFNNLKGSEVDNLIYALENAVDSKLYLEGNASRTYLSDAAIKTLALVNKITVVSEDGRYYTSLGNNMAVDPSPAATEGVDEQSILTAFSASPTLASVTHPTRFTSSGEYAKRGTISIKVDISNDPPDPIEPAAEFSWEKAVTIGNLYRVSFWLKALPKSPLDPPGGPARDRWNMEVDGEVVGLNIIPERFNDWVHISIYRVAANTPFVVKWNENNQLRNGGLYLDDFAVHPVS